MAGIFFALVSCAIAPAQLPPAETARTPESIGVEGGKVEVEAVKEDEKEGVFIYRTRHFEFTCDGKLTRNLLQDVARNFEATYELVKALPWSIQPAPEEGDRFRALLVRSRQRYRDEGGADNSSGIYIGSRKLFIVPFESIGIERIGNSYAKALDYRSDTLVHELTHQMMHGTLGFLPPWVVEGTAEYANSIPLRFGVFRLSSMKNGLRDYLQFLKSRGGIPEPCPAEKLFATTPQQWAATLAANPQESRRMYFTSYLLVNFFMQMDGDCTRFARFMQAIEDVRRQAEQYAAAVAAFQKQPGVTPLSNGRFRYPETLTPPEPPAALSSPEQRAAFDKACLEILLDGRTNAQLMDQIRSAYRRLGVRL